MWKPESKTLALGLILLLFSSLYSAVKVSEGAGSILRKTDKILTQVEEIRGWSLKRNQRSSS